MCFLQNVVNKREGTNNLKVSSDVILISLRYNLWDISRDKFVNGRADKKYS